MKTFITENFLLSNTTAQKLFHGYAKDLPIIDYHCHLPPNEIAQNKKYENLTQIWLNGDHYKWRAMRTLGVNEQFITGNASDKEKFEAWAKVVPYTLRNPLYHWTHLELLRYFDINDLLNEKSAQKVFQESSEKLQSEEYQVQGLIRKMKVESICTTDDPLDSLEHHLSLKGNLNVLPTFRPDKFIFIGQSAFNLHTDKLQELTQVGISNYEDYLTALQSRVDFFALIGGKLADHGLESISFFTPNQLNIETIFKNKREGKELTVAEIKYFEFHTLWQLCKMYHGHNWTIQFHLGAIRNNNDRMLTSLGPDTGFDSIGDYSQAQNMSAFLNLLDSENKLSKTILYNLNPADNEVFASMIGNFNDGTVKGKVQYGSAWWFLDQKEGMEKQINALSSLGILSVFVGMLTDSRSFLSFPRHEYFRRILCNLLGKDVENGELPNDEKLLGEIVSNICYYNAKNYLNLD
ncbi:MAG: glucuronate isomerase [Leadbetterella sp.]